MKDILELKKIPYVFGTPIRDIEGFGFFIRCPYCKKVSGFDFKDKKGGI